MTILQKNEIIEKANSFCIRNGYDAIKEVGEVEVYFMKHEVIIAKPRKNSSLDGLYGDGDTMPIPILIYRKDYDKFEITEYTEEYMKKKAS